MHNTNKRKYLAFFGWLAVFTMPCKTSEAAEIKQVLSGTTTSYGTGTVAVTIPTVDLSKSFLVFQTRHNSNRPTGSTIRGELTASDTINFHRVSNETSTIDIQWYVAEFLSGVSVQRGTSAQGSNTQNVNLPSQLNDADKTILLFSKTVRSTDTSFDKNDPVRARIKNKNNIEFSVTGSPQNHLIHWQIVEFDSATVDVQRGTTQITAGFFAGGKTKTVSLSSSVDLSKSILITSHDGTFPFGNSPHALMLNSRFINSSQIKYERRTSSYNNVYMAHEVIEFQDGSSVQQGNVELGPYQKVLNVTINPVDLNKSLALSTVQIMGGQNGGNTNLGGFGNDYLGEASITTRLTSPTNLEIQRNRSASYASFTWQVIEFNGPDPDTLDHLLISHDGAGQNCSSEPFTVKAINVGGATVSTFTDSITIDTQTGKGSFSLAAGNGSFSDGATNDGLATYTFHADDNGSASFSLEYKEGVASLDLDAYLTASTLMRDDDSEGALIFSASGFTVSRSALNNPVTTTNLPIQTQIAGNTFPIHLAAYGQDPNDGICGIIETYTGSQNIQFWHQYINPNSGTIHPSINATLISSTEAASGIQTVNFANGQAVVSMKYKDVGEIHLALKDNTLTGQSNNFVVKPAAMIVDDIKRPNGTVNPGATSMSGLGFVAAGANFSATVSVVDSEGDLTPNYGNESSPEGISLAASALVLPAGGRNGQNNDGQITNAANFVTTSTAGKFSNNVLSWNEYGVIKLTASVLDNDYLASGSVASPESNNVGRFYPAHFRLSTSLVIPACSDFTYLDQANMHFSYMIQAEELANNKLQNYDATLVSSTNLANVVYSAEDSNDGTNLISRMSIPSGYWSSGIMSVATNTLAVTRISTPDGPFNSLSIGLKINDALDQRAILGVDMNAGTAGNCTSDNSCDAKIATTTKLRYGRLKLMPSFGAENQILTSPLETEYFNGSTFSTNTSDSCTKYQSSQAYLNNYSTGLPILNVISPMVATALNQGKTHPLGLVVSSPGATKTGHVSINYNAPIWLKYNWLGSGDTNPQALLSFGYNRGHDRIIYWRELIE